LQDGFYKYVNNVISVPPNEPRSRAPLRFMDRRKIFETNAKNYRRCASRFGCTRKCVLFKVFKRFARAASNPRNDRVKGSFQPNRNNSRVQTFVAEYLKFFRLPFNYANPARANHFGRSSGGAVRTTKERLVRVETAYVSIKRDQKMTTKLKESK
jgi:hypothetical protein